MSALGTDWEKLRQRFESFNHILTPYESLSHEEFEQLKLSKLTYGQIQSACLDKIDYGVRLFASDEDTFHLLDDVAEGLGFNREKEPGWVSPFEIVRDGLSKRELTPAFVQAWGRLEWCTGVMCVLIQRDRHLENDFHRKLGGALQSSFVQERWFAHWMATNAPSLAPGDRNRATDAMHDLCLGIATGKIAPSAPYPREWFEKMLEVHRKTGKRTGDLKATYTRMPVSKIRSLLQDPVIRPEVLPALRLKEFRKIDRGSV